MSRIAKNDVQNALAKAGQNIKDAAGRDGISSHADIKAKLESMPAGTEKALTDRLYRFIDHRDFKSGNRITKGDVDRALAYATDHLLKQYDLNNNGYSKSEITKMSVTGQLAVRLAAELKGVTFPEPNGHTGDLAAAMAVAVKGADYISESDSEPSYVQANLAASATLDGAKVMDLFKDKLLAQFDEHDGDLKEYTVEQWNARDSAELLSGLADAGGSADQFEIDNAAAFAKVKAVFDANITDVKVFKVGPKDDSTGKLATDQGAYQLYVLGRTAGGKIAGVTMETVET